MSTLMMRAAGLEGYRELVAELGGDASQLIEQAELQASWLNTPDLMIPAWKGCKLLELSAEHLADPTFGLKLAQKQGLSILGPLGLMLQQGTTLEQALQDLKKFLHVHSQAGQINITSSGSLIHITYESLVSYQGRSQQLIDLSLAVGYTIISGLLQHTIPMVSAYFSYKAPDNQQAYQQFFDCPVIFGAAHNGVTLSRKVLERSLTSSSEETRRFLGDYLKNQESTFRPGLHNSLVILIRQLLPLGTCRVEVVSSALGIDKRTLQRRLKELGSSFQAILDQERQQLALQYLKESDLSMAQISDLLGYAEPSVFSRNFKRWFGLSPAHYIKQHQLRWHYRASNKQNT